MLCKMDKIKMINRSMMIQSIPKYSTESNGFLFGFKNCLDFNTENNQPM